MVPSLALLLLLAGEPPASAAAPEAEVQAAPRLLELRLGVASELTRRGGWAEASVGYRARPWLEISAGGLYTGSRAPGAQLDATFAPLWTDRLVHPTAGLGAVALFRGPIYLGLAPHLGAEVVPLEALALRLEVPVLLVLNPEDIDRGLYPLASLSAAYRF